MDYISWGSLTSKRLGNSELKKWTEIKQCQNKREKMSLALIFNCSWKQITLGNIFNLLFGFFWKKQKNSKKLCRWTHEKPQSSNYFLYLKINFFIKMHKRKLIQKFKCNDWNYQIQSVEISLWGCSYIFGLSWIDISVFSEAPESR